MLLVVGWRSTRHAGALFMALAWGAYSVYEYLMYRRVLCSGECNIRVDLLLIYPLLVGGALWTAFVSFRHAMVRRRGPQTTHNE